MTAEEYRKKKAEQMAAYYAAKGDSTSRGAKAAQRAVAKASGTAASTQQSTAAQTYRSTSPVKAAAAASSRKTTTPNPALAQAVVASVDANPSGITIPSAKTPTLVSSAGQKLTLSERYDPTKKKSGGESENEATTTKPSFWERIGLSAHSGAKNWAADYMDYAAAGTAARNTASKPNQTDTSTFWSRLATLGKNFEDEDITASAYAGYEKAAKNEQKVIDSYERGEGIYDEADYEVAKELLAEYQLRSDALGTAWNNSQLAISALPAQAAAESSKWRKSAAEDETRATSGLGKVGTAFVRGVSTTTQNLLDLGLSAGASARPSIAARVYGQSTQAALDNGDSVEKAVAVGLARAAAELIPEGLFGGNPLTDTQTGDGLVTELARSALSKPRAKLLRDTLTELGKRKYINNFVTRLGAGALGEGTEEVITNLLNDLINRIAYGSEAEISTKEENAEAFWGGVIGSLYGNVVNPRSTINNVRTDVNDIARRRKAAQGAAEGNAAQGNITTQAQPAQADSGAFNTAETETEAQPEQQKPITVLDIYQNRGTKQQPSRAMQTTLDALSADKSVPIEAVQAIPEVQAAYSHPVADDTSKIDTPERQQLRNQIADELSNRGSAVIDEKGNVEYTGAVEQGRQMDIVIGLPAAGKSSAVADPLSQQHHAIVVDSDEAKTRLPEYDNGYGAGAVHEESKAINAEILDRATERGDNIVLPIVGGSYASVMKYINLARENGYTVRLYLNELSSNKAIGRALQRFLSTGRFIRPEILYSYGNRPTEAFNQIIAQEGLVDGYEHYSNDVPKGERPRLIRSSDSGRYNDGGVERDSGADNIPVGDSRGEAASEESRGNDNVSRSGSPDRAAESQRGEVSAEDDGLYGRSVGAAMPRRGEQVESRNNLQHDANLSEEGRQAVADAGNTHERISNSLARSRAEANIARDGEGNWLNLQDCMDDLQATIEGGGVLTPEQVKLSEMVLVELDHIAREDGDRSTFNAFNRMVIQASKTAAGQSLNAWREFSNGYISTVDTATEIVEAARENPATNQNRKRTNREADEILRRVSNQVGEAADRTLMRVGLDERQADNSPKLRELITQSWQNKQQAYDDLVAYFVERNSMSEQEAARAANEIATLFYGELAELSSEALHRKFDSKKRKQTDTSWIDKAVELINMGALTDADFRAVASEKLFGARASDEVLSRISQYAEDAQELRDAGDVDGLRDHVVMLSTERGYKPSRGIQKILDQKTDVNDLYTLAQSLAVGIAVDQAKPSFGQKLATWQYLSHLYNTGTIMRNFAANTVFSPIDRLSNTIAIVPDFFGAMIRSASEGGTIGQSRTVARQPWGFNKNVRQTRKAYVDEARIDNALDINRGAAQGKYTGQTRRLTNRTFDQKGNWWNRLNNFREGMLGVGLNVADAVQKGTTKGQSEAAMNKLRQTGGVVTEEAAQAITEGDMLYRSFQRDTPLGTLLSITREWLNTIGIGRTRGRYMDTHEFGVGSLVDTYTQVPGALLHTAADYTPLGIVNTVLEVYNAIQFNRGQVDAMAEPGALSPQYKGMTNADASVVAQHNAALSVGRMATGGLIFGLFSFLAQVGAAAIRLYGDDDRDKDETLEAQGIGGFQFNQDAFIRGLMGEDATWQDGDIIHDLSQYPPVSTIAQLAVIYADDDNDDKFIRMLDATARSLAEQFGDLSMMSTAKTVYDDIQYRGDKNTWEVMGDIAGDLAGNAVTGMIPGTFRQLARTTDPYMRDTSADSVLGRAWNRFRSVTPGLRQTLPAKVDYKGEARQYTGNTLSRFLNAFVLPGNVTVYRQDDVVDYIDQLSEASGTSLYADAYAPKKLDYDGERFELDSDARRDYNEAYKSDYYGSVQDFMQSKYARAMSDDMAAEVASGLRGLAAYRAKREFFKAQGKTYAPENDNYKRYDSIADPALYMAMREAVKALTASGGTDNKAFNAVYLKWQSLSAEERAKYTDGVEGSFDGIDTLKKLDNCLQAGMSTEQFYAAKAEYKTLGDDDSLNAGTRRAEFAYWLDTQSGFDRAARAAALENFKFTTTIVSDEGGYEKMTAAGVSKSSSERIYSAIQALTPEAGYTNVSDLQKCETITGSTISEKEKLAALKVYASEAQAKYYQAAYDNGIKLDTWSAVRRDMHKLNTGNGNDVSQTRLLQAMANQRISQTKARAMFAVYYPKGNFDKACADVF